MNALMALIALALGLYAAAFFSDAPHRIFPGDAPGVSKIQVLGGIIHQAADRDFLLCSRGKCLRVLAQVPKSWEKKWAWVEGSFAGKFFLPKGKNGVDPIG